MGKVIAVCTSKKRGEQKTNIGSGNFLENWGIEGDVHAGDWHRQISLINFEKVASFKQRGADVYPGAFGENLVVTGIEFSKLPVGTLLRCNNVCLEITQIGKECKHHCKIYEKMGECIMPREGVFARVLEAGVIAVGDEMQIEERVNIRRWQAAVITLSDKGYKGEREDISGPLIAEQLRARGYDVVEQLLLPDEKQKLKKELRRLSEQRQLDLILTTGGTGFSNRDITPEATMEVATKVVPGIAKSIREKSMEITPKAMLSRAVSVICNKTLIINLPGSPKACLESMDVFIEVIPHAMELLRGEGGECAR